MYGTVETGVLADGVEPGQLKTTLDRWVKNHTHEGWIDSRIVVSDDGRHFMVATRFRSEREYRELADSKEQHDWYAAQWKPLIGKSSDWFDGAWIRE